MQKTLGGSIFAHNAIKFDYCLEEAVMSLIHLCDEVVALDAESDDGTYELLKKIQSHNPKLTVIQSKWEVGETGKPGYDRLAALANIARENLLTKWHFMLQADEVIHESSFEFIRYLINNSHFDSFVVRRLNIWGGFARYVNPNSPKRPVGDYITRLAKTHVPAVGDAENLERIKNKDDRTTADMINIFHYGFVRDPYKMIDRAMDIQPWFLVPVGHPPTGAVDTRITSKKEEGKPFDPFEIVPESELLELPMAHPKFINKWIEDRKHFFKR
jgi:hypothetical protein